MTSTIADASDLVTLIELIVAFGIFLFAALKSTRWGLRRLLSSFKFQLALATIVWLVGETSNVWNVTGAGAYDVGPTIHAISMGLFALFVLLRFRIFVSR